MFKVRITSALETYSLILLHANDVLYTVMIYSLIKQF